MVARTATTKTSPADVEGRSKLADALVLISMALVAVAIGVGLHLQMGLPAGVAMIVALSLFSGMVGYQLATRSVEQQPVLANEVERLEREIAKLKSTAGVSAGQMRTRDAAVAEPSGSGHRPALQPGLDEAVEIAAAELSIADSLRQDDVDVMEQLIRKMADQVNATERDRDFAEAVHAGTSPPVVAANIEASLEALRAAASTMRQALPDHTPEEAVSKSAVAESATEPEFETFLQPVVDLGDQVARHYIISVNVRGTAAQDAPDAARVERAILIAERMVERGKTASVVVPLAGSSLGDVGFVDHLTAGLASRGPLAQHLVLSFTQDDVRRFTAIEQATIQSFSALGFRFAVAEVTDLDMNFAAMSRAGFSFATIPAAILLAGLPGVDGVVPAGAVAGHLAVAGFSAIVIDIEDEGQLADIRKAAIALGQGPHFGGPQRVKADVVGGTTRKAA